MTNESPAELGIHRFRWWLFWLLQCERDRGADQIEGGALVCGGFGEDGHGGRGAREPDLVAGEGGQVGQEPAEWSAPDFPDSGFVVNSRWTAVPCTHCGLAAGSGTEVRSADVLNCTRIRCTSQRPGAHAHGSDTGCGGRARSSERRRTIRPSHCRSRSRCARRNAGGYFFSASSRTAGMCSCPGRSEK